MLSIVVILDSLDANEVPLYIQGPQQGYILLVCNPIQTGSKVSSVTIDTMPTNQLQTTKICLFCSGKVSRFKLLFRLCLLRRRLLRVGLPLTSFSPLPTPDTSPSSRFKSSRPWSRPATQTYQSTMTLWWKAGSGSP